MKNTLMERYGVAEKFLETFRPEKQALYTADKRRAFMGGAPTLKQVRECYGHDTARAWVTAQMTDLASFAGASKVTQEQIRSVAEVVVAMYPWLKVTELMYFFLHLKGGEWGNYYGLGNGWQVTAALKQFLDTRNRILDALTREDEALRRQEEERKEHRYCTYEEYLAWRRRMGMGEPFMERMMRRAEATSHADARGGRKGGAL